MISIEEPFCANHEIFDEDHCGCVPIVTESSCDLVDITADINGITIRNLTASIENVQVFNQSWSIMYRCVSNCEETESIALVPGDYRVYVNLYNAQWSELCSTNKIVTVPQDSLSSEGTNYCGEIKITTADGQIELQGEEDAGYFYKVSRVRPDFQSYLNCTTVCDSYQQLTNLPSGTYTIRAWNSSWQSLCLTKEIEVENSEGSMPPLPDNQTRQCGIITCTYGQGNIHLAGDSDEEYFFKISKRFDAWESVLDCVRNCGYEASVDNLENGNYTVAVYSSRWKPMCTPFNIELTGSSSADIANKPTKKQFLATGNVDIYPNPTNQAVFIDLKAYKGEIQLD